MQGGIFMANERNKKSWREEELKRSDRKLIGGIIVFIIGIVMTTISIIDRIRKKIDSTDLVILLLFAVALIGCLLFVTYDSRKKAKEEIKRHERFKSLLSKENFTEVYFDAYDDITGSRKKMILEILEHHDLVVFKVDGKIPPDHIKCMLEEVGCKFYAKLNEEDEIIVIAKDSNGKILYNDEIKNSLYFDVTFKFHKD